MNIEEIENPSNFNNLDYAIDFKERVLSFTETKKFYQYLTGSKVSDITPIKGLSKKKSFEVIYYLQEVLHIVPKNIEHCQICDELFDVDLAGKIGSCGDCFEN